MQPRVTPRISTTLTPALYSALNVAKSRKALQDEYSDLDADLVLTLRQSYNTCRNRALEELDMTTIVDLFEAVDAAVEACDEQAIKVLMDRWGVRPHEYVTQLCGVTETIKRREEELKTLRERRNELTSAAMTAGITQYRLSQATGYSSSTIGTWRNAFLGAQSSIV